MDMTRILLGLIALITLTFTIPTYAETLPQAIEYTLRNNPDIAAQITRRYSSDEIVNQARADFLPDVQAHAAIGPERSENPTQQALTGQEDEVLAHQEVDVTATQNLFSGFATSSEIARTTAQAEAEGYKIENVANDTAINVTEQYLDLLKETLAVKLANKNLVLHRRLVAMIQRRVKAGIDRGVDFTQAVGRLNLARANLIEEQSRFDDAQIKYARLVGLPPGCLSQPETPSFPDIPAHEQAAEALALENHPAWQAANATLKAAVAQHNAAKASNYPKIDLVGKVVRNRNISGVPGPNYSDSLLIHGYYTIFQGGKQIGRQRETAYKIVEAKDLREQSELQILETLRLSWNAWLNAKIRRNFLLTYRNSTYATLKAYETQFKIGRRTLLDLLNQQNEAFQSSLEYLNAQYTELFARYRILSATGQLLPFVHVCLPVAGLPPQPSCYIQHFQNKV